MRRTESTGPAATGRSIAVSRPDVDRTPVLGPSDLVGLAVGVVTAAAVLAPTLRPGLLLSGDMVAVARPPLSRALLGLGPAAPRAVPSDLFLTGLSAILSAALAQRVVLAAVFVAAAWGAARLAAVVLDVAGRPRSGARDGAGWSPYQGPVAGKASTSTSGLDGAPAAAVAALAASCLYLWNPFVSERLVIGHWALLLGWAALPWAVTASLAVARSGAAPSNAGAGPGAGERSAAVAAWVGLGLSLAVASLGGVSAATLVVLSAALVLAFAPGPAGARVGRVAGCLVLGLTLNLTWVVPGLLRPGGTAVDPVGLAAFASRPDTPLGTVGSVVTFGGIWSSAAVPPGRDTWLAALGGLALVAAAGWGLVRLVRRGAGFAIAGLAAAAMVGLLVGIGQVVPGLDGAVRWAAVRVPGGGVLRDAQKFVLPWLLLASVGIGAALQELHRAAARRGAPAVASLCALVPVALLPALAWGVAGRLTPATYPAEWATVARAVQAGPPGALAVLPWQPYRRFDWAGGRIVLDPAQKAFGRVVAASADLPVGQPDGHLLVVSGDDALAARLGPAVRSGAPLAPVLAAQGVGLVLVEHGAGPEPAPASLAGLRRLHAGPQLSLYAVPGATQAAYERMLRATAPPTWPVLVGDAVAAAAAGVLVLLGLRLAMRRRPGLLGSHRR